MGLLTGELTRIIREDTKNYGYSKEQTMHKTGFKLLDYMNGQIDFKDSRKSLNIGVDSGKPIMIVGKPGSGKSTFGIQLASSIMKKYDESTMFVFDFEGSHTAARIKSITGMDDEYYKNHVTLNSVGIYAESVLKLAKQISAFKVEHEKELLVDNAEGILDENGNVKKILPPTFIFIDSLSALKTKDFQEGDTFNGLTSGGRSAINNKELFIRLAQPCLEANIIVIVIAQVSQNMSMGVTPPVASTRYLKNTESVGGGSGVQYMVNLWLNVEAGEKLEEDDKYGIKGFVAKVTIVKSRNAEAGKVGYFVFNQREGFDEVLSEFEFMKANKIIKGAGVGMYLDGLETCKFRMSNLKEKYNTIPEFRKKWDETVSDALESSISVSSKLKFEETKEPEMQILNEDETAENNITMPDMGIVE